MRSVRCRRRGRRGRSFCWDAGGEEGFSGEGRLDEDQIGEFVFEEDALAARR